MQHLSDYASVLFPSAAEQQTISVKGFAVMTKLSVRHITNAAHWTKQATAAQQSPRND
jgi:hypothetical protein